MNDEHDSDFELDFAALRDLPKPVGDVSTGAHPPARPGEKHVVFHQDEKLYAVHSRQVAEVIGFLPVTPLPFVPAWIAGVANLRGDLISVVDLRKLWNKTTSAPLKTRLLVLRSEKENHTAAFMVDKLSEIITLSQEEIEFSAADFASSFPTFFGRATRDAQTIYLLDTENLFSSLSDARRLID